MRGINSIDLETVTVLARVYRGQHVESFHSGSIAVVDSRGHLLAFAGDPNFRTSLRSAAKPFQAVPLLEYGGGDEFELSPEEIALTCASHGGEPLHVSTAAAILRKGEFDESDLLCGAHLPYDGAGAWSITTPLMQAFGGELLAKEGAEGLYAMGMAPSLTERLEVADDATIGIALKVNDGSMTRGRDPVIIRTLELLGVDVSAAELQRFRDWPLRNVAGTLVGDVRAEF